MIVLPKIKNRISHTTQQFNSIPGYTPKRTESGDSNRDLYSHAHSSSIHNSSKAEIVPQMPINKQNVVYPYNETLISHKEE